jgi:hypothetical protein
LKMGRGEGGKEGEDGEREGRGGERERIWEQDPKFPCPKASIS